MVKERTRYTATGSLLLRKESLLLQMELPELKLLLLPPLVSQVLFGLPQILFSCHRCLMLVLH